MEKRIYLVPKNDDMSEAWDLLHYDMLMSGNGFQNNKTIVWMRWDESNQKTFEEFCVFFQIRHPERIRFWEGAIFPADTILFDMDYNTVIVIGEPPMLDDLKIAMSSLVPNAKPTWIPYVGQASCNPIKIEALINDGHLSLHACHFWPD